MKNLKKCSKCKNILPTSRFNKDKRSKDGLGGWCKSCMAEYHQLNKKPTPESKKYKNKSQHEKEILKERNRKYYLNHRDRILNQCKEYYKVNKEQVTKQWKKYYYANREAILKRKKKSNKTYISKHKKEILKRNKQYYQKNKEKISKESKTRYQKNKEHISIKGAEYRRLNKEKIKERDKKNYHKYKLNPKRKIANNLRRRLRQLLTENDYSLKMIKLLGCSIDDFKKHLSNNFQEGMTFENYGKWHIDHIIPCRLFDLSKPGEQMICFNYKNLQPLWAIDNLKKSSSGTRQLNFLQSL